MGPLQEHDIHINRELPAAFILCDFFDRLGVYSLTRHSVYCRDHQYRCNFLQFSAMSSVEQWLKSTSNILTFVVTPWTKRYGNFWTGFVWPGKLRKGSVFWCTFHTGSWSQILGHSTLKVRKEDETVFDYCFCSVYVYVC